MILSCQNISKAFVENQVLKNVSFHIEDHEKAAIVGINGAGKTTLLRIIVGEMTGGSGKGQDTWVSRPEQHRGHLSHHLRGTVICQGGSAAPGGKDPGMRKQYEACRRRCAGRPYEAVHLSHPCFRDRRRLSLPQ